MIDFILKCVPDTLKDNSIAQKAFNASSSHLQILGHSFSRSPSYAHSDSGISSTSNFSTSLTAFDTDCADHIAIHTQKGIDFLEKYGAFLKDRSQIELDYAKQLRALEKKYQPKKKEEEDYAFTYARAFLGVIKELGDIAGQHEVIAERFRDKVVNEIGQESRTLKDERKKNLAHATRLSQDLDYSLNAMAKAQNDYRKCFKDAESAQIKYEKAEQNMDLSRAELEKAKNNARGKSHTSEEAKTTYALQLQQTNAQQKQHYNMDLPQVFEKLRLLDEHRIVYMQKKISECVHIEGEVMPLIKRCLDEMQTNADRMDPLADSMMVVEKYRSGYLPPEDFEFFDMGNPSEPGSATQNGGDVVNGNGAHPHTPTPGEVNRGGKISRRTSGRSLSTKLGMKKHKHEDFKEDYSDLPPSQRCNKLESKLNSLRAKLEKSVASRDGVIRMVTCFKANPKLGDLAAAEAQLAKFNEEIDKLNAQVHKFTAYLTEAQSQMNVPINAIGGHPSSIGGHPSSIGGPSPGSSASPALNTGRSGTHRSSTASNNRPSQRSSLSEDSISSEGSSNQAPKSIPNGKPPAPATPRTSTPQGRTHGASVSPESGIGETTNGTNYADSDSHSTSYGERTQAGVIDDQEYYNDVEPLPVLGTATALFAFDVHMREGDEVLLVEKDEGDGWTRIRKLTGNMEGFVPTSYVDCKWYPNV